MLRQLYQPQGVDLGHLSHLHTVFREKYLSEDDPFGRWAQLSYHRLRMWRHRYIPPHGPVKNIIVK